MGHPRIKREKKTIEAMVSIYCKRHHKSNKLCLDCKELLEYAKMRLDKCPFQEKKSTCAKCLIHCYQPQMREKVRKVMRYAGPRMLLYHPVLAIQHVIDGWKKPEKPSKQKS
ncbi:MAG: nitrous oxide-stimulated promoter family protein [Candidatus Bathyarchaeales archaeon]